MQAFRALLMGVGSHRIPLFSSSLTCFSAVVSPARVTQNLACPRVLCAVLLVLLALASGDKPPSYSINFASFSPVFTVLAPGGGDRKSKIFADPLGCALNPFGTF